MGRLVKHSSRLRPALESRSGTPIHHRILWGGRDEDANLSAGRYVGKHNISRGERMLSFPRLTIGSPCIKPPVAHSSKHSHSWQRNLDDEAGIIRFWHRVDWLSIINARHPWSCVVIYTLAVAVGALHTLTERLWILDKLREANRNTIRNWAKRKEQVRIMYEWWQLWPDHNYELRKSAAWK